MNGIDAAINEWTRPIADAPSTAQQILGGGVRGRIVFTVG